MLRMGLEQELWSIRAEIHPSDAVYAFLMQLQQVVTNPDWSPMDGAQPKYPLLEEAFPDVFWTADDAVAIANTERILRTLEHHIGHCLLIDCQG